MGQLLSELIAPIHCSDTVSINFSVGAGGPKYLPWSIPA